MQAYRGRLAQLLNAPRADCVVPKTSAGQGLRAILNTFDSIPRVVATRGEFDSLDVILREYARRGRITLTLVDPRGDGRFDTADIVSAIGARADLVVVSQVMFSTGQRLDDLPDIVAAAHRAGGRLLLDVYHALGVFPTSTSRRSTSTSPSAAATSTCAADRARATCTCIRAISTARCARSTPAGSPSAIRSPISGPIRRNTGRAATHSWNRRRRCCRSTRRAQGRSSRCAIGVDRIRAHSLGLQQRLAGLLRDRGFSARAAATIAARSSSSSMTGRKPGRGSCWTPASSPMRVAATCAFVPDILTTDAELVRAADALAAAGA